MENIAFISKAVREAAISEALVGASKSRVAVHIVVILILLVSACSTPPNSFSTPPNSLSASSALPPAAPGKTWHVAFSEDFNGNDYDHNKLTPCFDWNYANNCTYTFNEGREKYMPEQVRVSDGTAKLVAEPLSPQEPHKGCYQDLCTYKAGLLSTARPNADNGSPYLFAFTYGYVEARIMYPAVPGFFTAFWMLPADPTYEYRSEIDIAEILGGDPDTVFMTYNYDQRSKEYRLNAGLHQNGACPAQDYSEDWVKLGVDWQPDHIAWYINGVKCGEFTDRAWIENGPMQIILNMMIDNKWERDWGSVLADQTLTDQIEVKYIRVYQQQ